MRCAGCEHDKSEHYDGLGCMWEHADGWLCLCAEFKAE